MFSARLIKNFEMKAKSKTYNDLIFNLNMNFIRNMCIVRDMKTGPCPSRTFMNKIMNI